VETRTSTLLAPLAQAFARVVPRWGNPRSRPLRPALRLLLALAVTIAGLLGPVVPASAGNSGDFGRPTLPAGGGAPTARLAGHVLPVLPRATRLPRNPQAGNEPLTLSVMLNRSDPAGFAAYARGVEDPSRPSLITMQNPD
jgi:hypothetical protein